MAQNNPIWPCIVWYSTEYYLEATSTACLHVRELCAALPYCLQRLTGWSPSLVRALVFAFFLLLRALNSFRAVNL
jgi:hypothetical protein